LWPQVGCGTRSIEGQTGEREAVREEGNERLIKFKGIFIFDF